MKAVRKIVHTNKEFFSFWLLLFFITASNARNVAPVFQDIHPVENHHANSGKSFVSVAIDDTDFGALSLKDSDVDDIELIYCGNYTAQSSVIVPTEEQSFLQYSKHSSSYKVPLYDLYCNWKFHLS